MRIVALLLAASCSPALTDRVKPEESDAPRETQEPADSLAPPAAVRVATFNTSMYRDAKGELATALVDGNDAKGKIAAAILQTVRPDIVLLNEFDYDPVAAQRFIDNYLAVAQGEREPLAYPHMFTATVNTGVPSGVDLDGSGSITSTPGSQAYGDDAKGFGRFEGQYGMVVLSKHPIQNTRTFQNLLWKDVPNNLLPTDHYSEAAQAVLPLSSKSHWDLTVHVDGRQIHILASHPTPPTFDGPEDRNGKRNHDEIRFWTDYFNGNATSWHVDDLGVQGGLGGAPFVLLGDLNSDPNDGDSRHEGITDLLAHPRVSKAPAPESEGAAEQAGLQGGANATHAGPAKNDTADFSDDVGNLRVDYAVPSVDLTVTDSGVFWPKSDAADFDLVGVFPYPLTDHRLVWVDVEVP